jgi:hypothetical protein
MTMAVMIKARAEKRGIRNAPQLGQALGVASNVPARL